VQGRNQELADFLRRARARISSAEAGLPTDGRIRRVPGLRREEVALLAGVSSDYYTRLEQGRSIVPSSAVIDAIARALEMDAAGQAHLRTLIGLAGPGNRRSAPSVQPVRSPRRAGRFARHARRTDRSSRTHTHQGGRPASTMTQP
jgi:transcriptional regulator with XRE-family HTH domain